MATGSYMTPIYSRSQSEVQGDLHNGAQRINPENRVGSNFRIIPEQYFSGVENIDDFLENIDHNLAYKEIPAQLACAYLKGHLKGRALDWFEVLGYRVIEDKTTDYAHLKQALSEQFPVVRNRSELETRFYSSSQRRDHQPSDFIYELLKIRKGLFSDQPGLTHVLYHEIDTGDKGPVVSRPYRYDRVKQGIIDYHIDKMLRDGTICPINSPYASPVVLTRKKNDLPPDSAEAYRFAIDYCKLNGYPRYPLPVIDDLLTNIPHTSVMSTLDLRSGYFQLTISPKDIEKTAFITRNGTFVFLRMPFGLSGAAPNFQRAIDIILKHVIERFVLVYMDDVIITSPSFKDHLDHLTQFNLFTDASGVGIGTVLQQNQKPIAFASRTLNKAERNYTVTERECLAVIWALNKFNTYFGPLPVKVITDHAALTKLTNGKNLSSRMIRWALKLSDFNIEWEHRPGVQNVVADLLSRNPVDSVDGSYKP
ncbi:retrovirus-related Pol polyprotein from transposon opus [Trichonephila clavipes]|nr:retrovirus-related Pol polyprotein from transposon opus [Trichonephila clavipes]